MGIDDELQQHRNKVKELVSLSKEKQAYEQKVGKFESPRQLQSILKKSKTSKSLKPSRFKKRASRKVRFSRKKMSSKKLNLRRQGILKLLGADQFGRKPLLKKRPMSPQQKKIVARLQELKKQQGLSNLDRDAVMRDFEEKKRQQTLKNALRNTQVSSQTRLMLERVASIHGKAGRDDNRMQRVVRERNLVQNATNLLGAKHIFSEKRGQLDFTGVNNQENILMARNVFKENPENNILKTKRKNILDTGENTLRF